MINVNVLNVIKHLISEATLPSAKIVENEYVATLNNY